MVRPTPPFPVRAQGATRGSGPARPHIQARYGLRGEGGEPGMLTSPPLRLGAFVRACARARGREEGRSMSKPQWTARWILSFLHGHQAGVRRPKATKRPNSPQGLSEGSPLTSKQNNLTHAHTPWPVLWAGSAGRTRPTQRGATKPNRSTDRRWGELRRFLGERSLSCAGGGSRQLAWWAGQSVGGLFHLANFVSVFPPPPNRRICVTETRHR